MKFEKASFEFLVNGLLLVVPICILTLIYSPVEITIQNQSLSAFVGTTWFSIAVGSFLLSLSYVVGILITHITSIAFRRFSFFSRIETMVSISALAQWGMEPSYEQVKKSGIDVIAPLDWKLIEDTLPVENKKKEFASRMLFIMREYVLTFPDKENARRIKEYFDLARTIRGTTIALPLCFILTGIVAYNALEKPISIILLIVALLVAISSFFALRVIYKIRYLVMYRNTVAAFHVLKSK
jgi:hypothetical protein